MSMSPTKRATASSRRTPDYSRTGKQATATMPGAVKVPTLVPGKQVLNANEAISISAEPMTQVRPGLPSQKQNPKKHCRMLSAATVVVEVCVCVCV